MKPVIKESIKIAKKFGMHISAVFGVLLFLVGTYNTITLNSVSYMQDNEIKFVKRLDELTDKIIAAKSNFDLNILNKYAAKPVKKLAAPKVTKKVAPKKVVAKAAPKKIKQERFAAVITQDLELDLVEVFNSKLFKSGLTPSDFSGKVFASNGVIESLEVELPNNQTIEVGYAEMAGNVFKYEIDGQSYSGMMYEVKKGEYMVTLANGPYQGTRMKFKGYVEEAEPAYERDVANNDYREELVDDYDKQYGQANYDALGNPGDNYDQRVQQVEADNGAGGYGFQFNSNNNVQ